MNFAQIGTLLRRVVKAPWLKETLLIAPRIALLIPKLLADDRVPRRTKLALGGLAVYMVSPWDLIPDFIPGLGQLDDAIVLLIFLDAVLNQVDDAVILDHWTGDVETLRRVQSFAHSLAKWTPTDLKNYLFGQAVAAGEKSAPQTPPARENAGENKKGKKKIRDQEDRKPA
jgi:uncharacterized membrane protein YkvA (DUF1232 family)